MKYKLIEESKGQFPTRVMCRVYNISESGYYAWVKRDPSQRTRDDKELSALIVDVWQSFHGIYGAPRIYAELREHGIRIGAKRVARLMSEAGIQGKMSRRKRPCTTQVDHSHPVAPNLLNRQFEVCKPHQVWLSDITYIDTEQGFLYLAAVMDLASREIVGLAMADHLRTELTLKALDMAVVQQKPAPGLMHHSDRGSQYTSHDYQLRLSEYGMIASMSRTGSCLDNAPMESFWATLKRECADHVFASHEQARATIFRYIIGFYNRVRRHSALNYTAPQTRAA